MIKAHLCLLLLTKNNCTSALQRSYTLSTTKSWKSFVGQPQDVKTVCHSRNEKCQHVQLSVSRELQGNNEEPKQLTYKFSLRSSSPY